MDSLKNQLQTLFGNKGNDTYQQLSGILQDFQTSYPTIKKSAPFFSEKDAVLICYADHVQEKNVKTLKTMKKFLQKYVKGSINKVHFLPFFPYSSDDGFSVIDYYQINSDYGNWDDVKAIGEDFGLMFDFVLNHVSQQSEWFQKFLAGDKKYQDYFITYDEEVDTSSTYRPRTHPVLTPFETKNGRKYVWTTFSTDQVDLNFSNPALFLEMVEVLLFYVAHGAEVIRMDAIAYAWKELGTSSIHLPHVHTLVKALRSILDIMAPQVWIITETNVPHKDNVAYFGKGDDEAHLVYNFALPPLLLHTLIKHNSTALTEWAKTLQLPGEKTAFFNFTASHDGIGINPAKGLISDQEYNDVVEHVKKIGGRINYRAITGEDPIPYELNSVYLNATGGIEQFIASQTIELALQGVPAIYFNSLVGAGNWTEGVEKLGYNRAINRQKFNLANLEEELNNPYTTKYKVYQQYRRLLSIRTNEPLFSPYINQEVIAITPEVFALLRSSNNQKLLSITNVTDKSIELKKQTISQLLEKENLTELISGSKVQLSSSNINLKPYQSMWLK